MLLELNFTLVLFAISFLVFIYLLNLTLFKPVGEVIEERKNQIEGSYKKASEDAAEANKILEDYNSEIKLTRKEAMKIVEKSINLAQELRQEKILELISQVEKEKEEAISKIKQEENKSMTELEGKIKLLTDLITSKIIGKDLAKV